MEYQTRMENKRQKIPPLYIISRLPESMMLLRSSSATSLALSLFALTFLHLAAEIRPVHEDTNLSCCRQTNENIVKIGWSWKNVQPHHARAISESLVNTISQFGVFTRRYEFQIPRNFTRLYRIFSNDHSSRFTIQVGCVDNKKHTPTIFSFELPNALMFRFVINLRFFCPGNLPKPWLNIDFSLKNAPQIIQKQLEILQTKSLEAARLSHNLTDTMYRKFGGDFRLCVNICIGSRATRWDEMDSSVPQSYLTKSTAKYLGTFSRARS